MNNNNIDNKLNHEISNPSNESTKFNSIAVETKLDLRLRSSNRIDKGHNGCQELAQEQFQTLISIEMHDCRIKFRAE